LVPLLARNAEQAERERRIPEESIAALEEAGLFRITVPRRFGGYEVDLRTKIEVSAELARGCGSTSWVVTLINVCNWFAGLYCDQAQQEVFGSDPNARVAGVFAPSSTARRVDGGLLVTGKWPFASGCLHASWAGVGVPVVDEAGEQIDVGWGLVPMSELTIEDTWFTAGMRGTGSNTLVAEDVFVPDHRILSFPRSFGGDYPTEHTDEVSYRSAFMPFAALILAGPQLGLARSALDYVVEKAPKRSVSYTFYSTQTEAPSFQMAVARAAMLIDTGHLHAYRAAADVDGAALRGEKMDYTARARVRMDTAHAIEQLREGVRILISAHGASSFAEASPLQRIWRDCEVASRHAIASVDINAQVYGQALLGIEGAVTALV
jgi:alkylation response protein AidB-like acyl-CoA dehydrogenase